MDSIQKNLDKILSCPQSVGVTTGIYSLDKAMKGLQNGHLITIAACSSAGKSSMMRSMVLSAAEEIPVGVFPIEGGQNENVEVMLYTIAELSYHKKGNLDYDEVADLEEAKKKLKSLNPIYFDEDADTMYPNWLLEKGIKRNSIEQSMEIMYNEGARAFFIDYLQLIEWGQKSESETLRLKNITGKLARLSIKYDVPIVILAQLKKSVEERDDPTPIKSDIRDSGFIINDSHDIILLHRPEYFVKNKELELYANCSEAAKIIIAKQRYGPGGYINATFKPFCMKWEDSKDNIPF